MPSSMAFGNASASARDVSAPAKSSKRPDRGCPRPPCTACTESPNSPPEGEPIVARNPESPTSQTYLAIAKRLAAAVSVVKHESGSSLKPKEISEGEGKLRIEWADGHDSRYPFELLRNHCPCAVCVDEWTGKRKNLILLLPSDFRPLGINPVGTYAIQVSWSDGHNTGIFDFRYLRSLAEEKNTP